MKDIKVWECVYEVLPIIAACERFCGWKYMCKLRQLTTVVAQALWDHTPRSGREVSQEKADEQSAWGGVGVHWDTKLWSENLFQVCLVHVSRRFGRNWCYFGEVCVC